MMLADFLSVLSQVLFLGVGMALFVAFVGVAIAAIRTAGAGSRGHQ